MAGTGRLHGAGLKRSAGRNVGLLGLFVLVFGGFARVASAEELELYRGRGKVRDPVIDFFVRGARPGEEVALAVKLDHDETIPSDPTAKVVADKAGRACFHVSTDSAASAGGRPFQVRAFVVRENGEIVYSKFVPLNYDPVLWLLVEGVDRNGRVLRFDPTHGALDQPQRGYFDSDGVLAVAGLDAIARRNGVLEWVSDARTDVSASFAPGEEFSEAVFTPDDSLLMALTREPLAGGGVLRRLRLLDAGDIRQEFGSLEVLRGGGRLVAAWVVTDDDSHRVLVVERDGVIREVMLGTEPEQGLTVLPLSPLLPEELLDVRVTGDLLVAVTRPAAVKGRKGAESRLIVVDLRERAQELEVALGAAALDVEVTLRNGVPTAIVLLENGYVDAIPLVPTGARTSVYVPGAWRMALSEELGAAYVLALEPGGASVVRLDLAAMVTEPAGLTVPGRGANELGIFGDGDGQWLYVIEAFARAGRRDTAVVDDRLWSARLEPNRGRLVEGSVSVHALGGFVRKVASR